MTDNTDETETDTETQNTRDEIIEQVRTEPWQTQSAIADDVGVVRSWVSEVLGEYEDLEAIREAYRKGLDLEADPETLRRLADAVELSDDVPEAVADRLRASAEYDDVERVRVEITPVETDGGDDR